MVNKLEQGCTKAVREVATAAEFFFTVALTVLCHPSGA